jgi:hypothetical protein
MWARAVFTEIQGFIALNLWLSPSCKYQAKRTKCFFPLCLICELINDDLSRIHRQEESPRNDKLQRIWKEADVAKFRYYLSIFPKKLMNITKKLRIVALTIDSVMEPQEHK